MNPPQPAAATHRRPSTRAFLALLAAAAVPALIIHAAPEPPAAPQAPAATRPSVATTAPTAVPADDALTSGELTRKQAITQQLEKFYGELYAEPLKIERDARLAHLVTTISLSRIDASSTTASLLLLASRGKVDPWTAQLAWEAVAARQWSLTDDERKQWLANGMMIAQEGGFPGPTAEPLLKALGTGPLDDAKAQQAGDLIVRIAEENDPATPEGKATFDAAAATVAAWSNPKTIERIVRGMGMSRGLPDRLQFTLAGLPSPATADNPNQLMGAWTKWLKSTSLGAPKPLPIPPRPRDPYIPTPPPTTKPSTQPTTKAAATQPAKASAQPTTGPSTKPTAPPKPIVGPFPLAERIYNPFEKRWGKEAELGNLTLTGVEVVFCVDATGSMAESNEYVTSYLASSVKALSTISTNVKAAAVYYRHEAEPSLQRPCCQQATKQQGNFTVRGFPLTSDIEGLVKKMKAQEVDPKAGHDKGSGAYFNGIATAAQMLGAKPNKTTARVIVCVGDTFVTPGTEQAVVKLAEKVKESGIVLVLIVRDGKAAESTKPASQAASGQDPIVYQSDIARMKRQGADPMADFPDTSFGKMVVRVISGALPSGYANRADPLVDGIWRIIRGEHQAKLAKDKLKA